MKSDTENQEFVDLDKLWLLLIHPSEQKLPKQTAALGIRGHQGLSRDPILLNKEAPPESFFGCLARRVSQARD